MNTRTLSQQERDRIARDYGAVRVPERAAVAEPGQSGQPLPVWNGTDLVYPRDAGVSWRERCRAEAKARLGRKTVPPSATVFQRGSQRPGGPRAREIAAARRREAVAQMIGAGLSRQEILAALQMTIRTFYNDIAAIRWQK